MACENCGEYTESTCTRCGVSKYCNTHCQSQHWKLHKDACKDNKLGHALQRIAHILHEAYLNFRENTWDTPINKIVDGTEMLTVYDGDQARNLTFFTPFPSHLVQGDTQVKMELLTAWACDEPHGFLHSLILKLLQGLNIDIEETTVGLRDLTRSITVVQPTGGMMSNLTYLHDILHIKSRRPGNRAWVIDLCGAQFGIYNPFHDSMQYFSQFVQTQTARHALGHTSTRFSEQAQRGGNCFLVYGLGGQAAQALNTAMDVWESQNVPLSQLRTLTEDEFEVRKAGLLEALDTSVRNFITTNDFTAIVRRERGRMHRLG